MLSESKTFGRINMDEAYFGAWVPVSQVETKEKPLHEALKPHINALNGKQFVPVRLVNRLTYLK